jgi:hypothetical protein
MKEHNYKGKVTLQITQTDLKSQNNDSRISSEVRHHSPAMPKHRPFYPLSFATNVANNTSMNVYGSAIQCEYCGGLIDSPHGNQRYHPDCAYEVKKNRSKKQFAELKALKKYRIHFENEAILNWLYNRYGISVQFDRGYLLDLGFDFNIYSSIQVTYGFTLFFINRYAYRVLRNNKIRLWKI